jgi:hypothetical protein
MAANRHFRDAEYLRDNGYLANADHLSGFAAECAIKGLIVDHLGGQVRDGFPYTDRAVKVNKHIGTWLWNVVASLGTGRLEPEIVALFEGRDPFADWLVGDRYAEGSHISRSAVDIHIDGARRAVVALESAALSMNDGRA